MFSLQKLLGKEDLFFGLLEASAVEAHKSVQTLVKLSKKLDQPMELRNLRGPGKWTSKSPTRFAARCTRPSSPPWSGRILMPSRARFTASPRRWKIWRAHSPGAASGQRRGFFQQIGLLEQATECVLKLVKSLRGGIDLEEVGKWNDRLQQIEGEADKAIIELYKDLYSGRHDTLKVIVVKELYEMLEKVIDRCRDVGSVVSQIVLKNS